ncbi:SRPBCC family protein [Ktedonospora formicarum]|uniref:Polyketide cyclase / dehydrase and lipid transport n=1 Tax=Ktedonospora formicarum TaxID=2778364 RepID=A0A8J3I059_9CHLR|nr:SRPBCC family protein [Ktedonospora formicarum]GHO44370.1 hypothetical protein KSX_25330 [Ktedonospora formicarum]
MGEYERSIKIQASRRKVEDFMSDVSNLPKYLPTTKHAEPQHGERVRVEGEAHGHHYDADGFFRMDKQNNRMEWGSDGEERYRGWLSAKGDENKGPTEVTVHLSFEPSPKIKRELQESAGSEDQEINESLDHALQSLKNQVEGKGGKVEGRTER